MPSRQAHRAALKRIREGCVHPPAPLTELPALPPGFEWRHPFQDYDYQRDSWELVTSGGVASTPLVVARIGPAPEGIVLVAGGHGRSFIEPARAVLVAARWLRRFAPAVQRAVDVHRRTTPRPTHHIG